MKNLNFRTLLCLIVFFTVLGTSTGFAQNVNKNKKGATAISNATQKEFTDYSTSDDAVEMEIATGCVGYSVSEVDKGGKIKELAKYSTVCLDGKSRTKKVSLCFPATNKLVVKYKKIDPKATVNFRPSKMECK